MLQVRMKFFIIDMYKMSKKWSTLSQSKTYIYQSGIKETDFLLAIDKKVSAQNGFTV